jgi:uncharacterized OsmC-like protein
MHNIRLVQDNFYTMKGSAHAGTMTGGAKNINLAVHIDSNADRDTVFKLIADAVAASPLNGLMRGRKDSIFTLTHNQRELALLKALPLGRPPLPEPDSIFNPVPQSSGDWDPLIQRGGVTPKAQHSVTLKNDSLAEQQDRLLHLRVVCTLRDDGVKQITQYLFNPHGSVFHFLCDDANINGGKGLAPDAASYISAGIGFCFMTQFGRYANIVKKKLNNYRIVQDTHFSLGGASGLTGKPGSADSIETHVYLHTDENDEFAQRIVDMAEQTCFLHAFCKTDLKANIKVQGYKAEFDPVLDLAL